MTLKEEFEQAFNYKIGSAKDDLDSIIQVDAEGLWEWIEKKVSQIDCRVMLWETIWRHKKNNYGITPNWLIMTGSFYDKLIYDLEDSYPNYMRDLMDLHKFEGIRIAVIPRTYGAEPKVETAT